MDNSQNKKPDISAPRLLLSAKDYLLAAIYLPADKFRLQKESFYCVSIELALKAFLRAKGKTEKDLRKIGGNGHDLVLLLSESKNMGLDLMGEILESYTSFFNLEYKKREFIYIDVGGKSCLTYDGSREKVYEILKKDIVNLFKKIYFDCYASIGLNVHQKNLNDFLGDLEDIKSL
jgi:hypothetical protein